MTRVGFEPTTHNFKASSLYKFMEHEYTSDGDTCNILHMPYVKFFSVIWFHATGSNDQGQVALGP